MERIYSTTTIINLAQSIYWIHSNRKDLPDIYIDELALSSINKYIANFTPSSTEY